MTPSNHSQVFSSALYRRPGVKPRQNFVLIGGLILLFASAAGAQGGAWPSSGLGSLPQLSQDARSRMVSPENPTGEEGKGGMAIPNPSDPDLPFSAAAADLGRGWKVRPFIKVPAHTTVTIMDVSGPGAIEHIWMATSRDYHGNGRASVLRFYWDAEDTPSVEVPMTDFFAIGHEAFAPVNSAVVVDVPTASMNCYWPMPFRKHARVTFTNDGDQEVPLLTYQIDYQLGNVPSDAAYFHAQWRRAVTERTHPLYMILDGVKGEGRYVGTFLAWTQMSDGWFGEGEVKFFIDGDNEFPTIAGTGTEDYFGADYGFPATYSTAYVGNVLGHNSTDPTERIPNKWSLYRWHIMDPINFHEKLKVTIQALGWWPNNRYQPLADDIASVAYWYQKEPHSPFPKFPPLSERWPR
jgi:hypothetical protein